MYENRRYIGADIVRIFAALIVVWYHLAWRWWALNPSPVDVSSPVQFPSLGPYARDGWVGVEIFFCLSGLVIAQTAARRSASAFVSARFLRLWPAMAVCATLTFVLANALHLASRTDLIRYYYNSLTFYGFGPWVDGSSWSLGVECSFYLLISYCLATGQSFVVPVYIVGLASATSLLAARLGFISDGNRLFDLLLLKHGCFFAIGCLLFASKGRLSKRQTAYALIMGLAAYLEIALRPDGSRVAFVIWLVTIIGLLISVRCLGTMKGRLATVIATLSLATYPLYLVHYVVGSAILKELVVHNGLNRYLALAITISLLIALAVSISVLAEPLVRVSLKKIFLFLSTRKSALPQMELARSGENGRLHSYVHNEQDYNPKIAP